MPSTTSFQSQQQAVDSQRHRSPPPPQQSSADQIPHPHHSARQQAQHHHQQSYATTSTPQQYASYYATHHHLVDHPTDGTPLHDPQAQQQSLRQEQHPLVDSEGLAAAELLAAFPQSEAVDAASSPDVSNLPQAAAAALTAQEAASADASHPMQHHPSTAQAIALPFPPPGSVPIAYFAGPNGSIIAIPQLKAKRRQVKNACTNCQKACKKCDEVRPCTRCVKYGIDKECIDSQRKERKKGIKRGPYKKREPKNLEEEDPTLPQGSGNLAATHILTPDNAAAFQLGGTVIYSYTPAMVQSNASGSATSSPSPNLPQSPTHHPQASSSSSPSSAQHHIQIQPAMLPTQMQFQKGPDGSLQYPPQYYIATQPVVASSGSGMEENANGEGSSSAGPSGQQVQIQPHGFPLQYFSQMAYAGFPTTGYVVQQPGAGSSKGSWVPRD
ncbi:hypothetical protein M407DRAFT_110022 [Tulasnella calospora MUT 4182]|uniref:Transcription activator of gluconeogenesis ERT1 n=1 Tax=Tulasnella calospora MUT 4182 TaxID=1051891 RepID=A0A0C3QD39_9AGAM|nr:hypothetical protein M407DRAFT_110022 [Tulasnella calospora MUT 4182]